MLPTQVARHRLNLRIEPGVRQWCSFYDDTRCRKATIG